MQRGLLLSERAIIESLGRGEKNLNELWKDLNLNPRILLPLLQYLMVKEIVLYEKNLYRLNPLKRQIWNYSHKEAQGFKTEVKEIFSNVLETYFGEKQRDHQQLKLKKVWMTKSERNIFNSMLLNIESYLDNLVKDRERYPDRYGVENLSEKKLVYWGYADYQDVIKSSLLCQ